MIRQGQEIYIRPEFQDKGDDEFVWIAVEDEDGDRVKVKPLIPELQIRPVSIVETRMLIAGDSIKYSG